MFKKKELFMKKKVLCLFILCALSFVLLGALICALKFIDVGAIGPNDSKIGLASVNGAVKDIFGFNETIYDLTELLGLISLATAACFGVLGVVQLAKRKSLNLVDNDIYLLGCLYVAVAIFYLIFEVVVINHRPVILEGELEASFPSSHTLLSLCIMISAAHQLYIRLPSKLSKGIGLATAVAIATATTSLRLASGVHWFTDILGGILLSAALLFAYFAVFELIKKKND